MSLINRTSCKKQEITDLYSPFNPVHTAFAVMGAQSAPHFARAL